LAVLINRIATTIAYQ